MINIWTPIIIMSFAAMVSALWPQLLEVLKQVIMVRIGRAAATEMFAPRKSRREIVRINDCCHLFTDRPIPHYCDYVWSYSGPRNWPQLPAFLRRRKHYELNTPVAHCRVGYYVNWNTRHVFARSCIYFGRAGQGRIPYFIIGENIEGFIPVKFVASYVHINYIRRSNNYVIEMSLYEQYRRQCQIFTMNNYQFPRDNLFRWIVTAGTAPYRIRTIIQFMFHHRQEIVVEGASLGIHQ